MNAYSTRNFSQSFCAQNMLILNKNIRNLKFRLRVRYARDLLGLRIDVATYTSNKFAQRVFLMSDLRGLFDDKEPPDMRKMRRKRLHACKMIALVSSRARIL